MAINTIWSVTELTCIDADGGVIKAYWQCRASSDTEPSYTSVEGGKLLCNYDSSSAGFISYASLSESDVLGWIYNDLREGSETADEAKARIESNRIDIVSSQYDRAETQSKGVPWI